MPQKIVIRVSMNDEKARTKALKIAVGVSGIASVSLIGEGKDQLQVLGDGIDSVQLTKRLRKNVAYAEIVSVGEDKKEDPPKAAQTPALQESVIGWSYVPQSSYNWHHHPAPYHYHQYVEPARADPICTIM